MRWLGLVALTMLSLSSCEKPIKCNVQGEIVIPAGASASERSAMTAANTELENRRVQATFGGSTPYTTKAGLEKAEGCP